MHRTYVQPDYSSRPVSMEKTRCEPVSEHCSMYCTPCSEEEMESKAISNLMNGLRECRSKYLKHRCLMSHILLQTTIGPIE